LHFIPYRINGPAGGEIRPDENNEDLPEPRDAATYFSDYEKSVTLSLLTVSYIVGTKLGVVY
jgi:hypothetical protein